MCLEFQNIQGSTEKPYLELPPKTGWGGLGWGGGRMFGIARWVKVAPPPELDLRNLHSRTHYPQVVF